MCSEFDPVEFASVNRGHAAVEKLDAERAAGVEGGCGAFGAVFEADAGGEAGPSKPLVAQVSGGGVWER